MGKFTVYRNPNSPGSYDDTEGDSGFPDKHLRRDGMQELGKIVQCMIKPGKDETEVIEETIKHFICSDEYEIRYEFAGPMSLRVSKVAKSNKNKIVLELVKPKDGTVEGEVTVNIERDKKTNNKHEMNIALPETGFDYLPALVGDVVSLYDPDPKEEAHLNYMKGALTFQRCL